MRSDSFCCATQKFGDIRLCSESARAGASPAITEVIVPGCFEHEQLDIGFKKT